MEYFLEMLLHKPNTTLIRLLLTGAGQHPLSLHDSFKLVSEIKKNRNTLMMCVRQYKKQQILHAFT